MAAPAFWVSELQSLIAQDMPVRNALPGIHRARHLYHRCEADVRYTQPRNHLPQNRFH
ncbi:hypothetical protein AZ54_13160 [Xanthomonas oryzae pv. oryzae PXO86]|uniref:NapD n=1 Tax=Xanthomonas oryzae pv. oryzae (strain PXO99A) TaxID=360094 RepID=A0A0K0GKK9_XANOP|nr:NapD [Xanthomonas oryzae pv. oryzae PXO99A]AJQ85540.1 hypothetical protein AZ54_13160 [Xanthomonas oryzae pv. oryzae PXO86]